MYLSAPAAEEGLEGSEANGFLGGVLEAVGGEAEGDVDKELKKRKILIKID